MWIYIEPRTKDGEEGKMTVPLIDGFAPFLGITKGRDNVWLTIYQSEERK